MKYSAKYIDGKSLQSDEVSRYNLQCQLRFLLHLNSINSTCEKTSNKNFNLLGVWGSAPPLSTRRIYMYFSHFSLVRPTHRFCTFRFPDELWAWWHPNLHSWIVWSSRLLQLLRNQSTEWVKPNVTVLFCIAELLAWRFRGRIFEPQKNWTQ